MKKPKIKLLFIVSTLKITGPTNQLFYILKNLDQELFSASILTLSAESTNTKIDDFKELNHPIYTLNLSRIESFVKAKKTIRTAVSEINPDLIHSQGIRPDIIVSKYLKMYPHVATLRNFPYEDYPMKFGKIMGQLMARSHIKVLKQIKHLVTVSNANANRIKELGVDIKTIQNGVDIEKYNPSDKEEKTYLQKINALPLNKTIFISVGSFISRKDPETIIKGFLGYSNSESSYLIFLGDGQLLPQLIEKYKSYKNILFKGNQSNVVTFLKASDYFISAAISEGLPNTVLEALACGVPVCLSNIEPHEEIIKFNNQAGTVFKTGNVSDLTKNIERLIKEISYKDRREASLSIIKANLSAQIMAKKYMDLYISIIKYD